MSKRKMKKNRATYQVKLQNEVLKTKQTIDGFEELAFERTKHRARTTAPKASLHKSRTEKEGYTRVQFNKATAPLFDALGLKEICLLDAKINKATKQILLVPGESLKTIASKSSGRSINNTNFVKAVYEAMPYTLYNVSIYGNNEGILLTAQE